MQLSSTGGDRPQFGLRVEGTPSTPHLGETRMKGNTPDFILEHFIILFSDVTQAAATWWELESTVMAIQHNPTKDEMGQVEIYC